MSASSLLKKAFWKPLADARGSEGASKSAGVVLSRDREGAVKGVFWQAAKTTVVAVLALGWLGCRLDMQDQPRFKPLRATSFYADASSARPLVAGTIAQGELRDDELFYTGKIHGEPVDQFPFPVTQAVVERGRERFEIYCSPCHGRLGDGNGMVAQRGFRHPPSYHIDRLRETPVGHFFDVITNGQGAMADYAARVAPRDRWAIAAYIRALQLSQNAALADVPESERSRLQEAR